MREKIEQFVLKTGIDEKLGAGARKEAILLLSTFLLRRLGYSNAAPPPGNAIRQVFTFLCWFPAPWKTPDFKKRIKALIVSFSEIEDRRSRHRYLTWAITKDLILVRAFTRATGARTRTFQYKPPSRRRETLWGRTFQERTAKTTKRVEQRKQTGSA